MLLAFEETVWSKKYFYWWTVRLHLNFYVLKIWRFHTRPCLAKISLWSVWRDLREAKCVNSGELYENLQIFVDLHSVSKVFKALRRLPKIKNFRIEVETRIKIQMFLKCFWLLRKPSDQKIFLLMNGSITFEFLCQKIWRFSYTFCLAKISLWSVWRDLREAKCVDLVVNYMKIFKFCGSPLSFKSFKALRRLPKIKNFRIEGGDTHKNSNVPQMLLAFEETVWSKIFLLMNGSITFDFLCHKGPRSFHAHLLS